MSSSLCLRAARRAAALVLSLAAFTPAADAAQPTGLPYDIVYVRMPRYGDLTYTKWPDVARPARIEPGSDLMLLRRDGTQEVLVAGGDGAILDPVMSLDGESVYFARFYNVRPETLTNDVFQMPRSGSDIYRLHLPTRRLDRLTFGEFEPNGAAGAWDVASPASPGPGLIGTGFGVYNLSPCPIPAEAGRPSSEERLVFSSNRYGYRPPKANTATVMQLFVMDADGKNVELITPMTVAGAVGPVTLRDGRILFSTHENQGNRNPQQWGLWAIRPDGTKWTPVVSAFRFQAAWHYATQLSDGRLVVGDYYEDNNNGFGAIYTMPAPVEDSTAPAFHSPLNSSNPPIIHTQSNGIRSFFQMSFTPVGLSAMSPFTHSIDVAAPLAPNGTRVGKVAHPSAAPGNELLLVWSPGPANNLDRPSPIPYYDGGIYIVDADAPIDHPSQMRLIINDPAYNEAYPRAVVPYSAVHGVASPVRLPRLENDGAAHAALPPGTPYGLVGASTVLRRETAPGFDTAETAAYDMLDPFNNDLPFRSANWTTQGAEAGRYTDDDIYALRVIAMDPTSARNVGMGAGIRFLTHAGERMRILGEIPLRKTTSGGGTLLDPEGRPDTSFLVKIPADTPFTFQTLDRDGMVLNSAQTWHQIRPGEIRTDCGSCHAHSQAPLPFESVAAGQPGHQPVDLTETTPLLRRSGSAPPTFQNVNARVVDVEFYRDIRPLLQRSCTPCHTGSNPSPPGNLVLDDTSMDNGLPNDYYRLARDEGARWGTPPVGASGWRLTNASRYIRKFQSRRSLLVWKLYGRRLDGWTNADHPTESVPGNPNTLPPGADPALADLDYTGTMMPPPGSGVPGLSDEERRTFVRWIDLGCPIDFRAAGQPTPLGMDLDDLRPTLTISEPRPGTNTAPIRRLRVGAADANSGVDWSTLLVTADAPFGGFPIGTNILQNATIGPDGVRTVEFVPPLRLNGPVTLTARVSDLQGNETVIRRTLKTTALGDLNGDDLVNALDLGILLSSWGSGDRAADLNTDGVVNSADLSILLVSWTSATPDGGAF